MASWHTTSWHTTGTADVSMLRPTWTHGLVDLVLPGVEGLWQCTTAEWQVTAGEVPRMTLELICTKGETLEDRAKRQRKAALEGADPQSRAMLETVYDLEKGLGPDEEVILSVLPQPNEDGAMLVARIVRRDSQT